MSKKDETLKMNTGNRLQELRKKSNLTQAKLGKKVGKSGSAIAKYEQGKNGIPVYVAKQLADTLKCSESEFIGFDSSAIRNEKKKIEKFLEQIIECIDNMLFNIQNFKSKLQSFKEILEEILKNLKKFDY